MSPDDFFDQPELDVFSSEVEILVIAVYKATIAGINSLDKQTRAQLNARDRNSHPEVDWEFNWWADEVSAMKCHAGNMALVSLHSLFEHWLSRNGGFQTITGSTLTKGRFDRIKTARNSIVHHHGKPTFTYLRPKSHKVSNEFLDFVSINGHEVEQVAITESALTTIVRQITSYVDLRNTNERKKAKKR